VIRGRRFTSEKELVEFIREKFGYKDLSGPYRRVKNLIEKGLLKRVPGVGYYPIMVDEEHINLIRRTSSLILDFIEKGEVVLGENEKYYGRKLSRVEVESLINATMEHILTAKPEIQDWIKLFNELVHAIELEVYYKVKVMYASIRIQNLILKLTLIDRFPEIKESISSGGKHLKNIFDYIIDIYNEVSDYEVIKKEFKDENLEELLKFELPPIDKDKINNIKVENLEKPLKELEEFRLSPISKEKVLKELQDLVSTGRIYERELSSILSKLSE